MPRAAGASHGPVGDLAPSRPSPFAVYTLAVVSITACVLAVVVAAPTGAGAGAASTPKTTQTSKPLSVIPKVRAGQPLVTPGHNATKGPIGVNPAKAQGVKLTILSGLLHGEPIYNGDFADPYALYDANTDAVYAYATGTSNGPDAKAAHIPVIAISRSTGFAGHFLGDALPPCPSGPCRGISGRRQSGRAPTGPLSCTTRHRPPTHSTASTR